MNKLRLNRRDSNPWPHACEAGAPLMYTTTAAWNSAIWLCNCFTLYDFTSYQGNEKRVEVLSYQPSLIILRLNTSNMQIEGNYIHLPFIESSNLSLFKVHYRASILKEKTIVLRLSEGHTTGNIEREKGQSPAGFKPMAFGSRGLCITAAASLAF